MIYDVPQYFRTNHLGNKKCILRILNGEYEIEWDSLHKVRFMRTNFNSQPWEKCRSNQRQARLVGTSTQKFFCLGLETCEHALYILILFHGLYIVAQYNHLFNQLYKKDSLPISFEICPH